MILLFGIFIACTVIVQYLYPALFAQIARYWFLWKGQYEFVTLQGTYDQHYSGFGSEVSFTGFYLAISAFILFSKILLEKRHLHLFLYLGCCGLILFAIILTKKRSMILSVPLVFVFMMYLYNKSNYFNFRSKYLFAITVVSTILFKSLIIDYVISVLTKNTYESIEMSQRELLWEIAIENFKSSPVFGKGLGSYDISFNLSEIRDDTFSFAGAHNSYIQLLSETGIIGFILWGSVVFNKTLHSFIPFVNKKRRFSFFNYSCSLACLIFICFYAFSGNSFFQPQQLFCFFFFLGVIQHETTKHNSAFWHKRHI